MSARGQPGSRPVEAPTARDGSSQPGLHKGLGQHHLIRPEAVRPLVRFLGLERVVGSVVEIGPGGGVLTRQLLAAGAGRVLAVELDREWASWLSREVSGPLSIWIGDALLLPWARLRPGSVVAGNLPYNVATPIVESMLCQGFLADASGPVERAAFLVQREVAERLAASPGTKAYGALSVLVAARAEASILGRVRPGAFKPPPRVESAFVGLRARPGPITNADWAAFARLVRCCFAQRRKTLRNNLAQAHGRDTALELIHAAELSPGVRAEELELAAFCRLFDQARERSLEGHGRGAG